MKSMRSFTLAVGALALAGSFAIASLGSAATRPVTTAKATNSATSTMHKAKVMEIDLNSASKEELEKLPGVGDATADKIIAGRPYASKAQLVSKNVVSKAEYAKIRGKVTAKTVK